MSKTTPALDFNLLADRKKAFKQAGWNMKEAKIESAMRLSTLGFHPTPTADLPQGVSCYYCQKIFDGKENPFNTHLQNEPCVFVKLQRNLKTSDERLQKQIDKCQVVQVDIFDEFLKSFGKWPHGSGKAQSTPTAEQVDQEGLMKVAKAGWLNLQYDREADDVICLSCSASLNEWEDGDDPLEEHRKRSPKCPVVVAAMENQVANGDQDEVVVEKEVEQVDKPVKVVTVSKKTKGNGKKAGGRGIATRAKKGIVTETETEFETATETATEIATETEGEDQVEIPEPEVVSKAKGKAKAPAKRGKGKGKGKVVDVDVEIVEDPKTVTPAESDADVEAGPSKSTDVEPTTRSKRGNKVEEPKSKKARTALTPAVPLNTNIPLPEKGDTKALLAYMELLHESTPVNSILTKEMLVETFEENSEKCLADFLGILGQKAGRLLDELMPVE